MNTLSLVSNIITMKQFKLKSIGYLSEQSQSIKLTKLSLSQHVLAFR